MNKASLIKQGMIETVDKSKYWFRFIIVVKKTESTVCICIDPHPVKDALHKKQCQLSGLDDILSKEERAM